VARRWRQARAEPDRRVHVHVQLQQDESGYPPFEAEELDAVELGAGLLRLSVPPTFAHGLAKHDVVRAVDWQDQLWVDALHEPSGHSVVRVVGLDDGPTVEAEQLVRRLGCDAFTSHLGLLVVDVPVGVPVERVTGALEQGRAEGRWDYDVGVDASG
jgi:hypothetical protein